MERPLSVASSRASSSQARPQSSGRNVATNSRRSQSPPVMLQATSTASLFVTNLRLLDFDLLPDWPDITANTFDVQNTSARIRGTEFALFQLFRFYDPMTTSERLQPFFPPLEPLQSINLRNALFRCLNELKKNGVLGKETVLRKSMLDDCQGDKFMELCLSFSATVVRKVTIARQSKAARSAAEQTGLARYVKADQLNNMLPLAIAHRSGMSKVLREKRRKHELYMTLYNSLIQKEAELQQRKAHVQEQVRKRPYTTGLRNIDAVEARLRRDLQSEGTMLEAVVSGTSQSRDDTVLVRSFNDMLTKQTPHCTAGMSEGDDLLRAIRMRADKQNQRLRKLDSTREKLSAANAKQFSRRDSLMVASVDLPDFSRHRTLTVQDAPSMDPLPSSRKPDARVAEYDEILTAMREKLRRTCQGAADKPEITACAKPVSFKHTTGKLNIVEDASTHVVDERESRPHLISRTTHVRPIMFVRQVSSRPRSYQPPKVDSQRQPIPFRSESFSLVGAQRVASASAIPDALESVTVHKRIKTDDDNGAGEVSNERPSSSCSVVGEIADSGIGWSSEGEGHKRSDSQSNEVFSQPCTGRVPRDLSMADCDHVCLQPPATQISTDHVRSKCHVEEGSPVHEMETGPESDRPPTRRPSLTERTRRSILTSSILGVPSNIVHSKDARMLNNHTSQVPMKLNKTRSATTCDDETDIGYRNVTSREELFSPEADYASVFRSRPRIGQDPNEQDLAQSGASNVDAAKGT